jgi:uncharacterized protein involved in exopolysaccharide biosynthesis
MSAFELVAVQDSRTIAELTLSSNNKLGFWSTTLMMRNSPAPLSWETPLSIAALIELVWARRWVFIITFMLSVAGVVAWAYLVTPTYRVTAKLMPREGENPAAGVQSLLGQFGGLAALAGIGFGASLDEQEAIAWLKSRALVERFVARKDLMPVLFEEQWDPVKKGWRTDQQHAPTIDDAWSLFDRRIRRVHQDAKSKLVTLEIAWKDRELAAVWANELVEQANEELRQRALREADASLDSLTQQLDGVDAVELKQSIYRMMEAQINRKVLAKARPDYAFALLDPATIPDADRFASPRRRLLVLVSVPLGLFAGACVVIALQLVGTFASVLSRSTRGS